MSVLFGTRCRVLALVATALLASTSYAQTAPPQIVVATVVGTSQTSVYTVYTLDPASGTLTVLPASPITLSVSARGIAINPAGTFLFVANESITTPAYSQVSVYALNQTTGALTEISGSPFATGFGDQPTNAAVDLSGKYLYVFNDSVVPIPTGVFPTSEVDSYTIASSGQLAPTPSESSASAGAIGLWVSQVWLHPNGHWFYSAGCEIQCDDPATTNAIWQYAITSTGDLTQPSQFVGLERVEAFTGAPGGNTLVEAYAQNCPTVGTLAISPVDGSLAQSMNTVFSSGESDVCSEANPFAFAPDGNFLYTSWGTIGFADGTVTPPANPTFNTGTAYVADPAGRYVFTYTPSSIAVNTVDSTTGALTPVSTSIFTTSASGVPPTIVISGSLKLAPAPAAYFSPSTLSFANGGIGVAVPTQVLTFANTGTATMNITNLAVAGTNAADFSQTNTCGATLAAGANCAITVTFTPSGNAAESAAVTVTDNAAGSPHSAILTSTAYVAPPPVPGVNPTSLSFPSTAVGATAQMSFAITNSGTQNLDVSGVAFSGSNPPDFSQSSSCATVAPSGSCTVNVTFQPQGQGLRTANAVVSFSNATPSSATVALSGQAAAPAVPFTVAPSGPTSSTVQAGAAATYGMSFTPTAGFSGTAMVACVVAPAGPSCTVSPAMIQVTASNNPTATPVTVTATAPTASRARSVIGTLARTSGNGNGATPLVGASFGTIVLGMFTILLFPSSRRASAFRFAAISALLVSIGWMSACGGGTSGGGGGTTPQTYSLNVTTTAGAAAQTVTYTLTVQ